MTSIILILQLVVALLSTPNMSAAQQAQVTQLANEAVSLVSTVLAQPTSTVMTVDTSTAPSVAPSTPVSTPAPLGQEIDTGTGTPMVSSTSTDQATTTATSTAQVAPAVTISVAFASTTAGDAFVTITNPSIQEQIAIKNLDVPGGSLTAYCLVGNGCDRNDPRTYTPFRGGDIRVGVSQVAVLHYGGTPTEVVYHPGSIVGVSSGLDYQF